MRPKNALPSKVNLEIGMEMPDGKYKDLPVEDLARNKPGYILFLANNSKNFLISSDLLALAISSIPEEFEEDTY